MRMKEGYHSTQEKVYGKIPRSEFYGFVLGYAVGTILRGIFNLQSSTLAIILAAIGVGIGIWYDRKYFMVKDGEDEAENAEEASDADAVETVSAEKVDDAGVEEAASGSMQQNLKKMFENIEEDETE